MKYNLSKIMKRAWEMNKNAVGTAVTFSDCLKTSWLQAKVELGVITMDVAKEAMADLGLLGKGVKKEEKAEVKEAAKSVKGNSKKDALIEKLEAIATANNSYDNGYHYEVIVSDWTKGDKNRTYVKIKETRDNSRHNKITEYGWYDNIANEYIPARYADINRDYARI